MFKFNLKTEVTKIKDLGEKVETYIIVGRMDAIDQPNRYMLQDKELYEEEGYRFDKGYWEYEDKIIEVKE